MLIEKTQKDEFGHYGPLPAEQIDDEQLWEIEQRIIGAQEPSDLTVYAHAKIWHEVAAELMAHINHQHAALTTEREKLARLVDLLSRSLWVINPATSADLCREIIVAIAAAKET